MVVATGATVVDLLDRLLDRGVVLQADVIISLSGVPLLGLNLRAALAGMETMLQFGLMTDWDEAIRAAASSSVPALGVPSSERGGVTWSKGSEETS